MPPVRISARVKTQLEHVYARCNRRAYAFPDPIAPLYRYENRLDQEVAGLIASALAFGNVKQIVSSVERVCDRFEHPGAQLLEYSPRHLRQMFPNFRHRYVTGLQLADMLIGIRRVLQEHGSLERCFTGFMAESDETILPAMTRFVHLIRDGSALEKNYLLPDPSGGSACKRLMMYARWMVRKDAVDLGLWKDVSPAKLIVPMDTHMHRIALHLGLTRRKTADMRAALEVTQAFRRVAPLDPVRYDFALTRLGIRNDLDYAAFLSACGLRVS